MNSDPSFGQLFIRCCACILGPLRSSLQWAVMGPVEPPPRALAEEFLDGLVHDEGLASVTVEVDQLKDIWRPGRRWTGPQAWSCAVWTFRTASRHGAPVRNRHSTPSITCR
ncbi:hypothetical protein ACIBM4_20500 [Streptomyces sp. NPDC050256]|uniref:hypothetical protein n=1 Tax=unclassified Streptomyces TaxID=2593676 RepID=UPI0037A8156E